jgi:hypothetical protein
MILDFDADPDPAFHSDAHADLDPASQNDADLDPAFQNNPEIRIRNTGLGDQKGSNTCKISTLSRVGKNPVFFFKPSLVGFLGFFVFFWVFWIFLVFFYIFAQKREF